MIHIPTQIKRCDTKTEVDKQKELRGASILKYGAPDRGQDVRFYINHVIGYDQEKRIPNWVAEHITVDHLNGSAVRKHSHFKEDTNIPELFRSSNSDYENSGWSRGHMAPASDSKYSQAAMDETFLFSNIVPQDIDNNDDFWGPFESYCRDLTQRFDDVRIITGPLFVPSLKEDGKLFMKYEVVGAHQVAVPTHLYKIVTVENTSSKLVGVGAFIVPNQPISSDHANLTEYQVPLEDLEKKTGFTFLPTLDLSQTENLCSIDTCKLMSAKDLQKFVIRKKLQRASDFCQLEKVWKEMEKKRISPEKIDHDLYAKKKEEIMNQESKKG
ncbi:nuclease EXOG, mitochondrial-like [Anneissia japonica]|uniref:nuclease EXOG, mitochondrial-like n=1 Tax=Anneissia japonica TaxID=1529436 RepID=UPI00142588C4|nr:nuclease EXOG, mitochondrial-like [Anneissia japonica]